MSFFSGSAHLHHTSKLPPNATKEEAIAMLSDHEFFLSCNPQMSKFEVLDPNPPPQVPEAVTSQARGDAKTASYSVTDVVHAIPAGIWDTNVVSTYEFTNITEGVFVRIRGPLSIVMDTTWEIEEGEDGTLELVEDIVINCSKLLVGTVRSECENGWSKIHAKMLARLEGKS